MPELRALTEHLVKTTVERSIASLLDRQRELESKVEGSGRPSFEKPHDLEGKIAAAIAPLLAKQTEFEKMLSQSRHAEVPPRPSLGAGALHGPEIPTSTARPLVEQHVGASRARPPPLPLQAVAQPASAVERSAPAMAPHADTLATAALSANALVDIPTELDGSRRKRVVVFLLVFILVGILASAVSLSVMSNMG